MFDLQRVVDHGVGTVLRGEADGFLIVVQTDPDDPVIRALQDSTDVLGKRFDAHGRTEILGWSSELPVAPLTEAITRLQR